MIDRTNYEEYFLMYVDNELSKEERLMVENFAAMNPDLNQELNLLLNTKLPLENISIDKQNLFADSLKLDLVDESLLLYVDNELAEEEAKIVQEKIKTDNNFNLQYNLLLKTKVDSTEKVCYPFKEELYRRVAKRHPFSGYWLRIAAAVVIILTLSVLWVTLKQPEPNSVAVNNPVPETKIQQPQEKESIPSPDLQQQQEENIAASVIPKKSITSTAVVKKDGLKTKKADVPKINDAIDVAVIRETVEVQNKKQEHATASEPVNNLNVTSDAAVTYINQQASSNTMVQDALVTENKGGSLKGLLRKATRFIERRTGVNPVNEDEKLLIGAVAINLK
jgi:hypothetical protein